MFQITNNKLQAMDKSKSSQWSKRFVFVNLDLFVICGLCIVVFKI